MASYVGLVTDTNGTTGPVGSTLYGTCATAAATVAKEVTLENFDKLITGVTIHVKFTNSNTATNPTLNVNGTGAKNIYRFGTSVPATYAAWSWYAGSVVSFTYDGSAWIMNDMIGNDNTYDRTSMQTRIYAGTNGVFPYCICAIDSNQRMQAMTTTSGTGTSKAFNSSQKFLYPPVIMYHSANSTITNGSVIANNVLYEQYPAVDMRYSCNITTSSGFAQYKPLYIECTFDDNGYWSPTGITQTFTAGKYYILLGCMYNTSIYQLALFAEHPVYKCTTDGSLEMIQNYTKAEKDKLAGIEDQANRYVHPTYTAKSDGMYRITVNGTGHVSAATAITAADVSTALNLLTPGSSNPTLNDYYISQYAGGGTTTTTYHRRPILSLWNTFKGLITVATTGDGNAITSVSIADDGNNRKITFTKGSTFSLSSHTHTLSLATDSGTSSISLSANTKYKLTAGGSTYVFTTPVDNDHITSATTSGSGNAVTSVTADANGALTVTKGTTFSTTDENVKNTVGTANTYYPAGSTSTSTATGTQVSDTSLKFIGTTGSTSAVGKAQLVLGNSTASGTAGNKQGSIVVYGSTAYAHTIQGAPTAARTLTLPDKTGTIAVTSDIPTVNNKTLTLKGDGTAVTTFTANASADTSFDVVAGSNVSVTADATNKKITIASSHPTITTSTDTTSSESPAHGGTFTTVDSVTRDSNGHVTKINTKTITLPGSGNTDTKVNVTLATTTKAYLLGTSTTPTSTAQAVTSVADTGVYLTTTAGHLQATVLHASAGVNCNTANSNSAGGLALYGTDPATYGIMFRGTSSKGVHGYVQSDWATYFTMNNADTRGWIFHKQSNVASISGAGNAVFNGSVTVGGNTTNTSGCRMVYNSTTQSLDFVFA